MLQRAHAVPAALGPVVTAPAEGLEVAQRVVATQDHVPAAAAVAAVGAALRDMGLAPERQRSIAAAPGPDLDSRAIGQHLGWVTIRAWSSSSPARRPGSAPPPPAKPRKPATTWCSRRAPGTSSK